MLFGKRSGFSLIELLTVIAIIALLAAIIFPVMSTVKKKTRQAECISNLKQIYTAVRQFQLDEGRYPEFIAGPVEDDGSGNPKPVDRITGIINGRVVAVYPEYIKSVKGLSCPLSMLNGEGKTYSLTDTVADPMFALGLRVGASGQPYSLYSYSSYDVQVPPRTAAAEAHYSTRRSDDDANADYARQMRWRTPPADTVVTWCSYHRDADASGVPTGGSLDPVLFLDGHVKPLSSSMFVPWTDAWVNAKPGT